MAIHYPNVTHYSPHFSRRELECHCGCVPSPAVARELAILATNLEALRAVVGGPLHVHDAHRCPTENARVGGVSASQHLHGRAADVHADAVGHARLRELARRVPAFAKGGIGLYGWGVHVDQRPDGPARWTG